MSSSIAITTQVTVAWTSKAQWKIFRCAIVLIVSLYLLGNDIDDDNLLTHTQ